MYTLYTFSEFLKTHCYCKYCLKHQSKGNNCDRKPNAELQYTAYMYLPFGTRIPTTIANKTMLTVMTLKWISGMIGRDSMSSCLGFCKKLVLNHQQHKSNFHSNTMSNVFLYFKYIITHLNPINRCKYFSEFFSENV